ncbi:ATP-binding cassette domain-containing protein [bacterium]|nr:ATP-binding cassette domain-containing protein [bacterium]
MSTEAIAETFDKETTTQPVIAASGLCFSYGTGELTKQILFDVDLNIMPGEIVLLTGHSGSGKTTLLTLIGGLRTLKQGRLEVLGRRLDGADKDALVQVRRQIGFIFQAHNLLDFLTARANVELVFRMHPEVRRAEVQRRAAEMLTAVGLGQRLDYYPSSMSGGQMQRVAIARALVAEPKLILADEPTAALDSKSGRDVVNILQRLAREHHIPILMVTHDDRVLDIADRIVHMEDGRIVS